MQSTKLTISAIFFLMLVQNHVSTLPPPCGRRLPQIVPLIMNESTVHQHWPWHAAIYHVKTSESIPAYEYKCGGTLISSKWILTAGHCVSHYETPMPTDKVSVSLGRLNLSENETTSAQSFEVSEIILHQNYSSFDLNNDIALVRVSREAMFTYYVQPICLWNSNQTSLSEVIGKAATVIGWGETEAGQMSSVLREASLTVVNTFDCLDVSYNTVGRFLTATKFCAGKLDGTNICFGDSGGSVAFEDNGQYHIRGIVSMTAKKPKGPSTYICDTMQYALFTDVAQFLPWIRDATIDCEIKVDCSDQKSRFEPSYLRDDSQECHINLNIERLAERCKIILNKVSNAADITSLFIHGKANAVPDLSDAVKQFENLIEFGAKDITMDFIDWQSLLVFKKIQKLTIYSTRVSRLNADTFDDLKALKELDLESNKLLEIPSDILRELRALEIIRLSRNQLNMLPGDLFLNNRNLREISCRYCHLRELPVDLFKDLHHLEYIDLVGNTLEILPGDVFQSIPKLRSINMESMGISELPEDIFNGLHNLRSLILANNRLKILPLGLFQNNSNLESLSLYQNQIKELQSDVFSRLYSLTGIYLSNNELDSVPHNLFRNNRLLVSISLNGNRLKGLHSDLFEKLEELWNIDLSGNQIEILPKDLFRDNRNLRHIDLKNNKIKSIECDFSANPNLKQINLEGNICLDEKLDFELFTRIEIDEQIKENCQNVKI